MYERKSTGIWLMYLRKSRQDAPDQTVEEVLAKHETQLQEYALRERGMRIQEENIYREVVSGETIEAREEIKKVLARIEDTAVAGVLVIEPQRLSRGDLLDCGHIINSFRFTHTQVITPVATYDLENKMDRKFFQDELLRGRDYLEYTKEILFRGRIAAAKRGCYIGKVTPFGYRKIQIGKDHTLEPSEDATILRSMYEWYVYEEMSLGAIAKRLNGLNIPSPAGGTWETRAISFMLKNPLYIGKIVFNKRTTTPVLENGELVMRRLPQSQDNIVVVEGKHPPIVDTKLWEAAQERFKETAPAQPKIRRKIPHSLCGIIACSCCGQKMGLHSYKKTEARFECRSRPRCYRSVRHSLVMDAIINTLEFSELPKLEELAKNGDGGEANRLQHLVSKLEKQMQEYLAQEDKQFEMLETGMYSMDVFEHRHSVLQEKMDLCQKQLSEAKNKIPKNVDYTESANMLRTAIELLKDPTADPTEQNRELKKVVRRISYTGKKSDGKPGGKRKEDENHFSLEITLVI